MSDVAIVGSSFREGATVETHNNTKGLVRAFDVRTGKLLWTFNTIPRPGEFGNDTWESESWAVNGNVGVWTQITVDEELGLVYLPVETPTSDYYGGHRPGNNLYAESIVCVDLKTGQRKWHFQMVHHPLWNYDMSSAAILADIVVTASRSRRSRSRASRVPVRLRSRHRTTGVADRGTAGAAKRRARREDQPDAAVPDEAAAYSRNIAEAAGRSDRLHARAARAGDRADEALQGRAVDVQPADSRQRQRLLGAINMGNAIGGTNWPGVAYDPEMHTVFAQANHATSPRHRWSRRRRASRTSAMSRASKAASSAKCLAPAIAARPIHREPWRKSKRREPPRAQRESGREAPAAPSRRRRRLLPPPPGPGRRDCLAG